MDNRVAEEMFDKGWAYLKSFILLVLRKYRIVNFMVVGGLGFVINMVVYYPLSIVFQNEVTFLGQHFYLPPFVISSLIAITSNYYFNRLWTFGDRKAKTLSYLRYLAMALATLVLDMFLLFVLVDYGRITPVLAAAIAIVLVFVIRYFIADRWIWRRKERSSA